MPARKTTVVRQIFNFREIRARIYQISPAFIAIWINFTGQILPYRLKSPDKGSGTTP
jgi:hypothetical protein